MSLSFSCSHIDCPIDNDSHSHNYTNVDIHYVSNHYNELWANYHYNFSINHNDFYNNYNFYINHNDFYNNYYVGIKHNNLWNNQHYFSVH